MALRLPVYIASVNNLSDARYCAGMGVKWLGFSTQDLGTILSENDLKGILQWVEGIETVLEIRTHKVDINHLHMNFDVFLSDEIDLLPVDNKLKILEKNVTVLDSPYEELQIDKSIDYVLLMSDLEIKKIADPLKKKLIELSQNINLILGFAITKDNLEWIEKELKPAGIMLKGGNEIRPGFKDFDKMAEILEYLELD